MVGGRQINTRRTAANVRAATEKDKSNEIFRSIPPQVGTWSLKTKQINDRSTREQEATTAGPQVPCMPQGSFAIQRIERVAGINTENTPAGSLLLTKEVIEGIDGSLDPSFQARAQLVRTTGSPYVISSHFHQGFA